MKNKKLMQLIAVILSVQLILSACSSGKKTEEDDNDRVSATDNTLVQETAPDTAAAEVNGIAFSKGAGLYEESFFLELSTALEGEIRYTLDGSEPTSESAQYTGAIEIKDRTQEDNNLSAIVIQGGGMGGRGMPGQAPNGEMLPEGEAPEDFAFPEGEMPEGFTPPEGGEWGGGNFMGGGEAAAPEENVFKGTVITAAVFSESGEQLTRSAVQSYFVAEDILTRYNLPIISIVTDSANFYDEETGLFYNTDGSGAEWERPVHFEMFEADGSAAVSQNMGVRLSGNSSRSNAQNSLRFYAKSSYDEENPTIEYEIFEDLEKANGEGLLESFKRITLRNSGNDSSGILFRDALMQDISSDLDLDTQSSRACVAFVNGEFWGVYNIRERYDDHYFANHYDIDATEVVVVEIAMGSEAAISEGEESDIDYYNEMWNFFNDNSLTVAENYQKALEYIDVDNFIDYYIANIYMANTDWPANNNFAWRYKTANGGYDADAEAEYKDGRFRWFLKDMDFGLGLQSSASADTLAHAMDESQGMGMGGGGFAGGFAEIEGLDMDALREFFETGELPEGVELPDGFELPQWNGDVEGNREGMVQGGRRENAENAEGGENMRVGGVGFTSGYSTMMFRKLLENDEFLAKFVNRFCDVMNTYYSYDSFKELTEEYQAERQSAMEEHVNRYSGNISSVEVWESNIEKMLFFAEERTGYIQGFLSEAFQLAEVVTVTLATDTEKGYLTLNGIEIHDNTRGISDYAKWSGEYFAGTEQTITATPIEGSNFLRFEVTDLDTGEIVQYTQTKITVSTGNGGIEITAIYE